MTLVGGNENKQEQVGDARPERDISVLIKHKVGNEMKNIFILWLNGLRTGGANRREGRGHKVWEGEGAFCCVNQVNFGSHLRMGAGCQRNQWHN